MELELYILDNLGTFTFASYGAYLAIKHNYDLFGIVFIGFLTAVGGGTIREVVIGNTPGYFNDIVYVMSGLAGVGFTLLLHKRYKAIQSLIGVLDSLGLVVFALVGAARASELGLGLLGIVFAATVTAVGGGMVRDVIFRVTPEVLYRGFYASVAVLLGASYYIIQELSPQLLYTNLILVIFFTLRLWAQYHNIHLWKPAHLQSEKPSKPSSLQK